MPTKPRKEDYVVETFRPSMAVSSHGGQPAQTRVKVHRRDTFNLDADAHPSLTSLWEVKHVWTQQEAMAHIIEAAAGMTRENVRLIVGHAPSVSVLPPEAT